MTSSLGQLGVPDTAATLQRAAGVAQAAADRASAAEHRSFPEQLNAALASHDQATADPSALDPAKARKIAGDLVMHALILPVLKQLRRGPFSDDPVFGGGIGEKTFGPEFDMQLADRIAHSPKMQVTDALARRLLRARGQASTTQPSSDEHIGGVDVHG